MLTQLIIIGVATGSIYVLIALAMTLVVNAVGVVNFATGNIMMVGAFIALTFVNILGLPWYIAYPLTLVAMGIFGVIFERIGYYPLRKAGTLPVIIVTMALGIVLKNVSQFIWGAIPLPVSGPLGDKVFSMGSLTILGQHALIIGLTIVLIIIQQLVFERTSLGRQMRALAQDKIAAAIMGIQVNRLSTFTFVYTAVICGIAGILFGPIFFVSPTMGGPSLLKAFAAIVLGGWGNVPGAILGGLLIGLGETFFAGYVAAAYKDVFVFGLMVAFLLFRPQGILGQRISEKV